MNITKKIIIGFSTTPSSLVSTAIRAVEQTPYSHVYLKRYSSYYNKWLVYQANNDGIYFITEKTFLSQGNKIIKEYELEVTKEEEKEMISHAMDMLGTPYGKLQILGMFYTRVVYSLFKKKVKNPLSDGKQTQVCSELLYNLIKNRFPEHSDGDPEFDGPKWIEGWVAHHGEKTYDITEENNG